MITPRTVLELAAACCHQTGDDILIRFRDKADFLADLQLDPSTGAPFKGSGGIAKRGWEGCRTAELIIRRPRSVGDVHIIVRDNPSAPEEMGPLVK